jgi:RNA polymerase-binding transcription factor DksA
VTRSRPDDAAGWRAAHQAFLTSLETLCDSPDGLREAAELGTDALLNVLAHEACRITGCPPEQYIDRLSSEPDLQVEIRELVDRLNAQPVFASEARAQRFREAERHLQVSRFILGGEEPDDWVWQSLDPKERARARMAREEADPDEHPPGQLEKVLLALSKTGTPRFGICEGCGAEIRTERIQLIPWAQNCAPCQRERDEGVREDPPAVIAVKHF